MCTVILVALAVLTWMALAVAAAPPVAAHAELEHTLPSPGTVLPTAPAAVELTFSEPVDVALGRVVVMGPDGRPAQSGPASGDRGQAAKVPLRPGLIRGTYLVSYRVVSADGHPVAGGFTFSVGAPSPLADVVPAADAEAPVRGWVRAAVTAARFAGYAGLVLLSAGIFLAGGVRRTDVSGVRPRPLIRSGYGLLIGGTGLAIVTGVPYASGGGFTDISWSGLVAQAGTTVHQAYLARLAILVLAAPLVRRLAAGRALAGFERLEAGLLAPAMFATWPLSGHSGTGASWPLTTAAGLVHVAAMTVWLGGLTALLRCVLPTPRMELLRAVLIGWSRTAAFSALAVVTSGVVQALPQTGSVPAVTDTAYGRLLVAKTALTLLVLAAGWTAHRLVTRRLRPTTEPAGPVTDPEPRPGLSHGGTDDARQLRRVVAVELTAAAVVVCLATALVQAAPGRLAASRLVPARDLLAPPSPGQPAYGIERSDDLTLQVDVAPLQVGRNTMLMTLINSSGLPVAPQSWTVDMSMPAQGIHQVAVPVDATMGAGTAVALPQLSVPGDWQFVITVRTGPFDVIVMRRSIRIY